MRKDILKLIDHAETAFFEDFTRSPDVILVNTDGMALLLEALQDKEGIEFDPFSEDLMYEDKYVAVCTHKNFPLFKLAFSDER